MSSSRHPIAQRLERSVGDPTKLLATVMLLPLVDGIFPALVLAGALDTWVGIVQVGILVFGGSATLAVILAEMHGTRREQATTVLLVGAPLIALAAIEAALAPTIAEVIDLDTFGRFAALVVGAIAAKTASARIGEYLPRPAVIVGLGLVASIDPAGAQLALAVDPMAVLRGVAAGAVGVGFALGVALLGPRLRANVVIDRFRFGSAVALGLLALSIVGLPFGRAPLAVIAVTALFTYDPSQTAHDAGDEDQDPGEAIVDEAEPADDAPNVDRMAPEAPVDAPADVVLGDSDPIADGGPPRTASASDDAGPAVNGHADDGDAVEGDVDGDRPPWL